jgi:hypothetical protein
MRSLICLAAIFLMAQAPAPEVDITGHYTQDGMKDVGFVRITRNGEVYRMLQRYTRTPNPRTVNRRWSLALPEAEQRH